MGEGGRWGGGIDRLCGKICKVSIFKAESEECRLLYPKAWRLTVCRPCTPGTPASPSVHPPPMDATYTYSVLITHLSTVGPLSQKSCCNGVPSKSSVSVCLTVSMTRNSLLFCHDERGGKDGLRIRRGKKRSQMFTLPCLYSSLSVAPSLYLSMWMHFKCCGGFFFFFLSEHVWMWVSCKGKRCLNSKCQSLSYAFCLSKRDGFPQFHSFFKVRISPLLKPGALIPNSAACHWEKESRGDGKLFEKPPTNDWCFFWKRASVFPQKKMQSLDLNLTQKAPGSFFFFFE